MSENYKTEKIGVTALCRVSAKGGEGIYLYIPKNYADAYGIVGAEYVEVLFRKIFFKVEEATQKPTKTIDMRSRPKKEKAAKSLANEKQPDDYLEKISAEGDDFTKGDIR